MKCYFVVEEVYQRYNEGYVAARPQGLIELRTVWKPKWTKDEKKFGESSRVSGRRQEESAQ
jgi:hypothetical protein